MNSRRLGVYVVLCAGCACAAPAGEGVGLRSLPPCDSPRFEVTGRVWPERVGTPHVCLWKDDALAAVSITIDDNTAPDHAWWLEQGRRYGVKVTWFVITSLVNDERPGYHGSWEAFRKLHRAGHDIQSHTLTHISPNRGFDPDDPAKDLAFEYRESRGIIEKHVPGQKVLTLAFPGGKYQRGHTDATLAARYYVAARGGVGHINPANRVNYRQTASVGNGLSVGDTQRVRTGLVNLIDRDKAHRPSQYRGWYVTHFHRVAEADKPRLAKGFAFLRDKRSDIWTGLFRQVAMYGQQRDTAKVTATRVADREIRFTLTDRMIDAWYDYPLTVKIRIPNTWGPAEAVQGTTPAATLCVKHKDSTYALVQAVPDRGEVTVRPARTPSTPPRGAQ